MTTPTPQGAPTPASPPAPAKHVGKLPFELQSDESVLLLARRHWAFLTAKLAKDAVFGLIPVVAVLLLAEWTVGLDSGGGQIVIIGCVIWFVFFAVRSYFTWYRYQNDIWVVTNQGIVDSSRKHWFNHGMASADLDDVEDIRVVKDGFFPTVFKYGDVRLQTAGELGNFVLSGIPDPSGVLALIDRQRDVAKMRLRGV